MISLIYYKVAAFNNPYFIWFDKNVYIDKLDYIVNKYNNISQHK